MASESQTSDLAVGEHRHPPGREPAEAGRLAGVVLQRDQLLPEGDAALPEHEPGAQRPGGVVLVPDEERVGHASGLVRWHAPMHGSATLFLVRHGETDWNAAGRWQGQTDVPLNARGREQAREIADRLRAGGDRGRSPRATSCGRGTPPSSSRPSSGSCVDHLDPDLRERRFGCFEGLTREEVAARFPEAWARYLADPGPAPPGGRVARRARSGGSCPPSPRRPPGSPGPLARRHARRGDARAARRAPGRCPGRRRPAWPLHGIQNGHVFRVTLEGGRIAAAERVGA